MRIKKNISLRKFNTFGINVKCKFFYVISNIDEIYHLFETKTFKNYKYLMLGEGSNILFTKDYDGIIIKNEILGKEIISDNKINTTVKVGSGENWHDFVLWSVNKNLSGLENMALIPGNVGSAPIQNIGAYGAEVKDVIHKVWTIEIKSGKEKIFENSNCLFEYRNSVFKKSLKDKFIITHVSLRLNKTPNYNTKYRGIEEEIKKMETVVSTESICQAVINIRRRKLPDPKKIGNSGSFFKNPIISKSQFEKLENKFPGIIGYKLPNNETKVAAGWLIEKCGWKGYRNGDAGVHKNQALVIVNYGNASGKEILSLAKKIQQSVNKKFGIQLIPEVNIV